MVGLFLPNITSLQLIQNDQYIALNIIAICDHSAQETHHEGVKLKASRSTNQAMHPK
jgi:hypothetical protein